MKRWFFILALVMPLLCGSFGLAQTQPSTQPQPTPLSADDFPDFLLHGEPFGVVSIDLELGDKLAWSNAYSVIMGLPPTTKPLTADQPLPQGLEQSIGPFFKVHARRIDYSVNVESKSVVVEVGIRLPPGADEDAAIRIINDATHAHLKFTHEGDWIIMRMRANGGNASIPALSDNPISPRADEVRRDLAIWGNDVPVNAAYLPSESLRKFFAGDPGPPRDAAAVVDLFWKARYVYLGVHLGAHPSLHYEWAAPDPAGADEVIHQLTLLRQALSRPDNDLEIPAFVAKAFDSFPPVRQGSLVTVTMNQKDLSRLVAQLIAGAMSQSNQNPNQVPPQTPIGSDWKPTDPATDSAAAQMRLILAAITEYDQIHHALPNSLNDLLADKLLPGPEIFHDPRTGIDNGFLYFKLAGINKLADISSPAATALLFESKNNAIDPNGLMGYADGHVQKAK